MIGAGAIVSLVVGIGCELVVIPHTPADIEGLVRLALLLPSAIFLIWWALVPGVVLAPGSDLPSMQEAPAFPGASVVERMRSIETTFDAAAVPAARRTTLDVAPEVGAAFRRSVRAPRRSNDDDLRASYGLGGH